MSCIALCNMSSSESFGIVLLEAWLAGMPVIANKNCAVFRNIAVDGVNDLMATDDNLAEKLHQIASDAELRDRFARNENAICDAYGWKTITKKFVSVCNEFTAAKKGVPVLPKFDASMSNKEAEKLTFPLPYRRLDHESAGMGEGRRDLNFPPERRRQLLVDISTLAQVDAGSGIQRVTRAILREWLLDPPQGWSVEPIYATAEGYRYARRFTCQFLNNESTLPEPRLYRYARHFTNQFLVNRFMLSNPRVYRYVHRIARRLLGTGKTWADDAPVDAWAGDVFVGLDLAAHLVPQREGFFADLRACGIAIVFVVYDLLPVLKPDCFPDGMTLLFPPWLRSIARVADGLICISRATLDDLRDWLNAEQPERQRPLRLGYFHMGADVDNSCPSTGLPVDAGEILQCLQERATFLMVGTVEPRKGHAQTLAAFERFWAKGHDVNLVIVGKQGWTVEALAKRLRRHREAGRRLFWLQGISDEYLERIYAASTCLIAASLAEGFGLPLIEAARYKLPIIARDIPVFREVAGDHVFYFSGDKPENLAEAISQWLSLHAEGNAPKSDDLPWLTWQQSAKTLEAMLMDEKHPQWTHAWQPRNSCRSHSTRDPAALP